MEAFRMVNKIQSSPWVVSLQEKSNIFTAKLTMDIELFLLTVLNTSIIVLVHSDTLLQVILNILEPVR